MTRNDVLRDAHNPKWNVRVTGMNQFPFPPDLLFRRWLYLVWIVGRTVTDFTLMAVVLFARIEDPAMQILHGIRFHGAVLNSFQARRRRGLSSRNDLIVNQILVVPRRVRFEFSFRDLLSIPARHRHPVPVET